MSGAARGTLGGDRDPEHEVADAARPAYPATKALVTEPGPKRAKREEEPITIEIPEEEPINVADMPF